MACAQASNSTPAPSARSYQRLRNVDDRAGLTDSANCADRPAGVRGSGWSRTESASSASRSCFAVTVCVRRPPASAGSDSRVSATASSIPERHEEFAIGRAMISRHAFERNQMSGEIPAIH